MNTTTALQVIPVPEAEQATTLLPMLSEAVAALFPQPVSPAETKPKRGRPLEVSWGHLWLGLLTCVLRGMDSYQDWWRLMCSQVIGGFAPVEVTDDALI